MTKVCREKVVTGVVEMCVCVCMYVYVVRLWYDVDYFVLVIISSRL